MSNITANTGQDFIVYRGHIVTAAADRSLRDIASGALVVARDGKIVAVGEWSEIQHTYRQSLVIDCGKRLILPGLIDLHIHLPQFAQIGKTGQTLLTWLQQYIFPAEAKFKSVEHATKIANWFFNELLLNGTTLAVVFTTIHKDGANAAFEVAAKKGCRAIIGKVMMDKNAPAELLEQTEASLAESEELCRKWHGFDNGRLMYAFTPRFAVTSTSELLSGTAKLWRSNKGTYVHTHLAESLEECPVISEQFPQCRSYTDVYASHGLFGARAIFAHSIHLDDADIALFGREKAAIAHCPSSNFFLKSGVFPYERVDKAKVLFGLGSDVAAGPDMSMFRVMKDANFMQQEFNLSPEELFYRATLGGAKALHLEDAVGSLEPGKEADFILVNPNRKSGIAADILEQPLHEILSSLVFLGDDRLVEATFVRGRCVYQLEPTVLSVPTPV